MIGTGVFTSLGYQLVDIQSVFPLMMLWIVGGIVALCGSLVYSELGTALPRSGGEYHLLSRIIHPSIGFAAGIVSATVGFTAPAVLAAMALGSYLSAVTQGLDQIVIAAIVILGFHGLHMMSVKWGIKFQDGSTAIKIGLILIFIAFGLFMDAPQPISIWPKLGDGAVMLSSGFAVSLVWVSYAYTGWNSAVYVSGEIMDQQKNIPRAMLMGTAFVMFMYVLLNYIFLRTTPMVDMVGQVEVGYIAGNNIFGNVGAKIMGLGISVLLLSTISSFVYIGPRIMQVMGEDHEFIGFLKIKNKHGIILAQKKRGRSPFLYFSFSPGGLSLGQDREWRFEAGHQRPSKGVCQGSGLCGRIRPKFGCAGYYDRDGPKGPHRAFGNLNHSVLSADYECNGSHCIGRKLGIDDRSR